MRQFASDDVDRVGEGKSIRVERVMLRGFEHQGANGVMREQHGQPAGALK